MLKRYVIILDALIVFFFSVININGSLEAQDTNYMHQVLQRLTSDQFHGRGYSYRGDSIAAEFIRSELRRHKVEPLGDNYYQNYNFSVFSMEGPLSFEVNGKRLKAFCQYRVPAWSQSAWGNYKVICLPAETLVDSDKLTKALKKHKELLKEVFVYIDATAFNAANDDDQKKFKSALNYLRQRNPFNSRGLIVGVKELNTYSPAYTDYEHGYSFVEVLAEAMPRKVKEIHCNIFTQFHPSYPTQNVCGFVKGEVDTMIVFTAHYDHLGTMGDSVVFYGAHDNGSGVAALLDIARLTVHEKPHYTHVFCFFSGEEAGLKGSKFFVEHPLIDLSKVRLLINIDMFCGGDEGLMVFNANSPQTKPYFDRLDNLNKALEVAKEIRPRENRPNSDHYYFSLHVPAIFILTMGGRYGGYHDPSDVCNKCGLENYLNYIALISSLAY